MTIEARLLIEPQCAFVFSAGEQHDLVAALLPGFGKSMRKDSFAPTLPTMRCMSDDILDDPVRSASAREIRNDGQRATRNERAGCKPTEVLDSRVGKSLRPNSLDRCTRRRRFVALVQVRVQSEQRLKLVGPEFTDVHVSGLTVELGAARAVA